MPRKIVEFGAIFPAMDDNTALDTNFSLNAFLMANGDVESEDRLSALVLDQLEPTIKRLLRGKLHVTLLNSDERQINQDALDLVSEVKTLIIPRLRDLKEKPDTNRINNLEAYVRTITENAYHQYLRRKHPLRLRLKNQLRYLLTHHGAFALWKTDNNEWACGFAGSQQEQIKPVSDDFQEKLTDIVKPLARQDASGEPELVIFLRRVFSQCDGPLFFADLVSIAAEYQGIKEPLEIAESENLVHEPDARDKDIAGRLEQKDFLKHLWDEIGRLPLRHRLVLLLNLKDSKGEGLIGLFPVTRIASIRQIAEILEFRTENFARVWNELPWDDLTIAGHLNLTRQQVINLRQSARASLRRRLKDS